MTTPKQVTAAKDYPNFDIAKGDLHWTWSLRNSGTHRSKTRPKNSELTESEFWKTIYSFQEQYAESFCAPDKIEDEISTIITELEDLKSSAEDARDNAPENFREKVEEKYQGRIDALETCIAALEAIETDAPSEGVDEWVAERHQEVRDALDGIECD